MLKRTAPVLLLIVGAALGLGSLAFRSILREYDNARTDLDQEQRRHAERAVGQVERIVADAIESLEARLAVEVSDSGPREAPSQGGASRGPVSLPIAWLGASGTLSYASPVAAPPPPSAEEQAWFDRARLGGESYEFGRQDPARARDAYSFYLERIEDARLHDRLKFRIARVSEKLGRRALARTLWLELASSDSQAWEGRLPIDLAAAVELHRLGNAETADASSLDDTPPDDTTATSLVHRELEEHAPSLDTPTLRHFVGQFAPNDPAWRRTLAEREFLEEAQRAHADTLAADQAVIHGGHLLLTRAGSSDRLALAAERLDPPTFVDDEFPTQLLLPRELAAARAAERQGGSASPVVRLPVVASGQPLPIAWVEVRDPGRGAKVALLDQRKQVQQGLVLFLLLLGGGATGAGWIAIDRQRRLAELKVRLLANVSHELKTPITSIRIFSELLAEEALSPEKVRQFGHLLNAESLRLTQRIEDLLDYAQTERSGRPLSTVLLDPVEVVGSIAETFRYRAKEHDVAFHADYPTEPPPRFLSNANAIERIILNLLDNALKYRREDAPRIDLGVHYHPEKLEVRVTDNGIGITARDQVKIFDEFYRANFEEYGVQGTGLGLAIARSLAGRIGGVLSVKSRPAEGSTFTLEVPWSRAAAPSENGTKGSRPS